MNDTLAGASPVDQPVRPVSARLDVLRVLLAERHPEHHAAVSEAQAEIERLRAELARRSRGECICVKCGLRQDGYDAAGHAADI